MSTENVIRGNWKQFKGMLKEHWNQLTDNDLKSWDGTVEQLVGVIQAKTGEAREDVMLVIDELMEQGKSFLGRAASAVQSATRGAATSAHEIYDDMSGRWQEGHEQAQEIVRRRPTESVAVALGTGLIVGVIIGLVVRSR
jgi:uncharacterized protein YjbJ (UPF0337 family)